MSSINIKVGGTWRSARPYIKVGGVWQTVQTGWIKVAGVWQKFYQNFLVALANGAIDVWSDSPPGDPAVSTINFLSDGTISFSATDSDAGSTVAASWGSPTTVGIGSQYWIRITPTSGTFSTNGASGWTSLSATVSCTKQGNSGGASIIFTVEISTDSGGSTIVATSTGNQLRYTHT
jgi:hypothetical protein